MGHAIEHVFLGWDAPVMRRSASWLCDRYRSGGVIDLSEVVVVMPGGRAGRQLTAALVDEGDRIGIPLFLPRVVTPAGLLDVLVPLEESSASEVERAWAWRAALVALPPDVRRQIASREPAATDLRGWIGLARSIDRTHVEVVGEGLRFAEAAEELSSTLDAERWSALAAAEREYMHILARKKLVDPPTERLDRINSLDIVAPKHVVLLGVSELSQVARRALNAVLLATRVVVITLAPHSLRSRFDDLGCVLPEEWKIADVRVPTAAFRVVHSPMDQADAALDEIEQLALDAPHNVVIGSLDGDVQQQLLARGPLCGVQLRAAAGVPLSGSRAHQLLQALADYCKEGSFRGLGTLVRHADVERWLASSLGMSPASWLAPLEQYAIERLPSLVCDVDPSNEAIWRIVRTLDELLGSISPHVAEPSLQSMSHWCAETQRVLDRLKIEADDESLSGVIALRDVLNMHMDSRVHDVEVPCGVENALQLLADAISDHQVPTPGASHAVEMLGWLELVLDDSRAIVVTGFNEGNVPARSRSSLLGEPVRRSLRLPTSDTRAARDRYLLAALAGAGRSLRIICGKVSKDANPLLPSRLMFACDDDEVVRRVELFAFGSTQPMRRPREVAASSSTISFAPFPRDPQPSPFAPRALSHMPVTAFRDYLASPYAYYIKHVLRLREVEDRVGELDAAGFGNLVHECLREFGASPTASSTAPHDIDEFLSESLRRRITSIFASRVPVSVQVQQENARARLRAFARWQSERIRSGWHIWKIEWSPPPHVPEREGAGGVAFDVDAQPVMLTGRIDRIDRHDDGRIALLDYKTAKDAKSPERTHRATKSGVATWTDLQLPLYRHLASSVAGNFPELGYICLPMKASETGDRMAMWTPDELASADECARDVVRRVRNGEFFLPGDHPPSSGIVGWLAGASFISEDAQNSNEGEGEA